MVADPELLAALDRIAVALEEAPGRPGAALGPGAVEAAALVTAGALGAYGVAWLDHRAAEGSPSRAMVKGIESEISLWRRHVTPSALASLDAGAVVPGDVEAFLSWLSAREAVSAVTTKAGVKYRGTGRVISTQTQRHVMRLVRQAFDHAIRRGVRMDNPARLVKVRAGGSRDIGDDWLRPAEVERLLSCADLPRDDRTVYAFAIGLALRLGDLKALRREDVRLDDDAPHIRITIQKTGRVHRAPILPWLMPWVEAHLATMHRTRRLLFAGAGDRPYSAGYDFGWSARRRRKPGARRATVTAESALHVAGIDRKIRFHDLRGTAATCLAIGAWGRRWDLREVQTMLAHSDQRVTERYVRRALGALDAAAAGTTEGPEAPAE